MPATKKAGGAGKGTEKSPAATTPTTAKESPTKKKHFGWIIPSKGGVTNGTGAKGRKYAKEHSIRYYVFNLDEEANAIGIVIYGERDPTLTLWLSKLADNAIHQETGDFGAIPFFDGTFFLHNEQGNVVQNDRGQ